MSKKTLVLSQIEVRNLSQKDKQRKQTKAAIKR